MQIVARQTLLKGAESGLEGGLGVALFPADGQLAVVFDGVFRRGFWRCRHVVGCQGLASAMKADGTSAGGTQNFLLEPQVRQHAQALLSVA